jgi:AraC-like DNA-binding protein
MTSSLDAGRRAGSDPSTQRADASRVLAVWTRRMLDETAPGWQTAAVPPLLGLRAPNELRRGAWFIPHADMITAWAMQTEGHDDPLYGLHFAERWTLALLGPMTRLASFAPTLGDLVAVYTTFDRLLDSHNLTTLEVDDASVVLTDRPPAVYGSWPRHLAESILGAYLHVVRTMIAGPLALSGVEFMHPAPAPAHAEAVAGWFDAPVHWSAPVNRLVADAGVLALPMWSASGTAFSVARATLARLRDRVLPDDAVVERVRALLRRPDADAVAVSSIDDAAKALGMSARTLQRRLGAAGLSFRRVLADVRAELLALAPAEKRLAMAKRLGFADDSALRKFLRRSSDPAC